MLLFPTISCEEYCINPLLLQIRKLINNDELLLLAQNFNLVVDLSEALKISSL